MRTEILSHLEKERLVQQKNEQELLRYRECDPAVIRAKGNVSLLRESRVTNISLTHFWWDFASQIKRLVQLRMR